MRGALLAGAVGIAAIVAPLLLAVVGADYFIARNVIVAVLPLAIAIAAGFAAAPRPALGTAAAGVLCALLAAIWVGVLADADRHRSDWRELARELGDPVATRALLVDADAGARSLGVYRPGVRALDAGGERIRELVIVGDTKVADDAPPSVDGLRLVQVGDLQELSFARYRSELPIRFKPAATLPGPQFDEEAKSLVEPAPGRRLADDLDPAFCRGDWGERKAMAVAEGP